MLKHNILLFFRNIKKHKNSFTINIIGLSTGLACVLLICLWVMDEMSVDKFHENNDELYQIVEHSKTDGTILVNPSTSGLLAETLAYEVPEVKYAVSSWRTENVNLKIDQTQLKASGLYVSPDYFNVFSYPLLQGDKSNILDNKSSIVISKSLAEKLFGTTEKVVGKTLKFGLDKSFQISGIFEDIPSNSSNQFDFVISYEFYKEIRPQTLDWKYNLTNVYVVLKPNTDINEFNKKISNILSIKSKDESRKLSTRLYSNTYLYSNYKNGVQKGGRIDYVKLFGIIAFLILLIACINFVNLSTAEASRRLKEIGVKKALGSKRKSLIFQHLSESLMMVFLSLMVAFLLIILVLPQFNEITGKNLSMNFNPSMTLILIMVLIVTGLISGSYPALFLSKINSLLALKGKINNSYSETWSRKGLVIFQFSVSIILIVSVLIIYMQIEFLQTKNLGYDKENIVYFDIEGEMSKNRETFLSELKNIEGITNASSIGDNVVGGINTWTLDWEGKLPNEKVVFEMRAVDYEMIETLDIKIKEGRTFSKNYGAEKSKIIFNQQAIDIMRLKDPIGKEISIQGTKLEIVGITEDFHFRSLHEEIKPLFFVLQPTWTHLIMVKIESGKENIALSNIQTLFGKFNPGTTFDFKFLDDTYQTQYISEKRIATLSKYFAGLAIIISCLGLFGLATFTAERRRKEIGIRKVLGQSAAQITIMLSEGFVKLVLISIIIALPFAYLLANNWLSDFAYRISLQYWYFALAGILAILVAIFTVSFQAIKAARANPIESLRTE